jgi:hypothetical protein
MATKTKKIQKNNEMGQVVKCSNFLKICKLRSTKVQIPAFPYIGNTFDN